MLVKDAQEQEEVVDLTLQTNLHAAQYLQSNPNLPPTHIFKSGRIFLLLKWRLLLFQSVLETNHLL